MARRTVVNENYAAELLQEHDNLEQINIGLEVQNLLSAENDIAEAYKTIPSNVLDALPEHLQEQLIESIGQANLPSSFNGMEQWANRSGAKMGKLFDTEAAPEISAKVGDSESSILNKLKSSLTKAERGKYVELFRPPVFHEGKWYTDPNRQIVHADSVVELINNRKNDSGVGFTVKPKFPFLPEPNFACELSHLLPQPCIYRAHSLAAVIDHMKAKHNEKYAHYLQARQMDIENERLAQEKKNVDTQAKLYEVIAKLLERENNANSQSTSRADQ